MLSFLTVTILCLMVTLLYMSKRNRLSLLPSLEGKPEAVEMEKRALLTLARSEEPSVVGQMADALEFPDARVRQAAAETLTRLLPCLRASDAFWLNARQRAILCRALQSADADLVMAILRALRQIGGRDEMPSVEQLARGRGKAAGDWRVQEMSQRCLALLRDRAAQEQDSQTLLRATDASATAANILLRPVSSTPDASPRQLLRASAPPESQDP
ncbi:MAG TPA: hypothetical protein VFB38_24540 [Chthonomonadaceae bacterium]|nr:hypothetical protein [Chthonomonadaceae bacterium]